MTDLFARLGQDARARLRPSPPPGWVTPMLATLTGHYFSDAAWIFERKLDGERCLAFCVGGDVRLLSRSQQALNGTYPEIVESLAGQGRPDIVVDGEVVALEHGQTSFSLLQQRLGITDPDEARLSPVAVYYYIFDLLHLAGNDTTGLALRDRKRFCGTRSVTMTLSGSRLTAIPPARRISSSRVPTGGKAS